MSYLFHIILSIEVFLPLFKFEDLDKAMKMLGCSICIGGVFAYSLVPRRSSNTRAHPPLATPKRAAAALLRPSCSRLRAPLWAGPVEMPRSSRLRRAGHTPEGHGYYLWDAC